jgi:hypothetical protein
MTPPESNKEWWKRRLFAEKLNCFADHVCKESCDDNYEYDIPAIVENQHRLSVQACMEVVESASLTGDFDAKNIKLVEAVYELAKKQFISALSEMKEKPRV